MATLNDIQAASSAVEIALTAEAAARVIFLEKAAEFNAAIVTESTALTAAQAAYDAASAAFSVSTGFDIAAANDSAAIAAREEAEAAFRAQLYEYLQLDNPEA